MTLVNQRVDVPVTIDESLCIEGCTLCVEICPLDSLAINPDNGKAFMHVDECWYCGPCAARCPTGAVTVTSEPQLDVASLRVAVDEAGYELVS